MKKVKLLLIILLSQIILSQAYAIDILCSRNPQSVPATTTDEDDGGFSLSDSGMGNMSLNELFNTFSSGAGVKSKQPILLCLFPQTHQSTIQLFDLLGIDNSIISTFFNERNIIIRRAKLVHSDQQMIDCVASSYPSMGYIEKTPADHKNLVCF